MIIQRLPVGCNPFPYSEYLHSLEWFLSKIHSFIQLKLWGLICLTTWGYLPKLLSSGMFQQCITKPLITSPQPFPHWGRFQGWIQKFWTCTYKLSRSIPAKSASSGGCPNPQFISPQQTFCRPLLLKWILGFTLHFTHHEWVANISNIKEAFKKYILKSNSSPWKHLRSKILSDRAFHPLTVKHLSRPDMTGGRTSGFIGWYCRSEVFFPRVGN